MLQSVTKFLSGGTSALDVGPDNNDNEDDDVDIFAPPSHTGSSNANSFSLKNPAIASNG